MSFDSVRSLSEQQHLCADLKGPEHASHVRESAVVFFGRFLDPRIRFESRVLLFGGVGL